MRTSIQLAAGALTVGVVACTGSGTRQENSMPSRSIEQVLATHTDSLMSLPSVVGTAIGTCEGEPCIRVFVTDSTVPSRRMIPTRLDGYPVRVDVTGRLRPLEGAPTPQRAP